MIWLWIGLTAIAMILLAMLVGHRLARVSQDYPAVRKEPAAAVPRNSGRPTPVRRVAPLRLVKG